MVKKRSSGCLHRVEEASHPVENASGSRRKLLKKKRNPNLK
jgi:hypothetical protein